MTVNINPLRPDNTVLALVDHQPFVLSPSSHTAAPRSSAT